MDRNAFFAFALSFLVLSLWMTWEAQHRPRRSTTAPAATGPAIPGAPPAGAPAESAPAPAPPAPAAVPVAPAPAPPPSPESDVPAQLVEHDHALFRAAFTTHGAAIDRWELTEFQAPSSEGGGPVVLIDGTLAGPPALATPFVELGIGDLSRAPFRLVSQSGNELSFELERGGVGIRKTYVIEPDAYVMQLRVEVGNRTERTLEPSFTVLLPERERPGSDFRDLQLATLVDGSVERMMLAAFGQPGLFSSLFGGGAELERVFSGNVEWIATDSHYFVAAVMPDVTRDAIARWEATEPGRAAVASLARPVSLLPGTSVTREYRVYIGPKIPERLAAAGSQLDRTIQLGWSWIAPVTRAFSWLLDACYRIIPNYGVAIILLTVLVKLATAPLASKQMRSMKRMGELQPKMREIQEKYRDDRQRQSQEMMKLYRETGVNPLGGCLPMLLQIPVFIGLYYALQSSISLRQAPFLLWIDDLSRPETLFTIPGFDLPVRLLPLLMAASMVVQQKLTPTTMDPQQARMMMVMMPLMMGFLFYTFPSGLVLYWFVSNLLAIGQQLLVNRGMRTAPA